MQTTAPGQDELRRLVELRLDRPVVLSLYLDLDPREFATPPARATAARSLLDDAHRKIGERDGISHQEKGELKAALERAQGFLEREFAADGARSVAVFSAKPGDLFEVVKLPRPVDSRVAIGRAPYVAPIARMDPAEHWCIALVNRRVARIFHGSPTDLVEVENVEDDVHGQHQQGGWSQARYERSVEKDVQEHWKHTGDAIFRLLEHQPFDRLVLGGPHEVVAGFQHGLHPYLADRVAGHIDVDVENTSVDAVHKAARPLTEKIEDEREAEALQRLAEGSRDGGRAVSGLDGVLAALNEQRVEKLLLDERFGAAGVVCPADGWVGPAGDTECPLDGTQLEQVDDVVEPAVELAVRQRAQVLPVRRRDKELRGRGGIGALLRF